MITHAPEPVVTAYSASALVAAIYERLAVFVTEQAHPGYGIVAAETPRLDGLLQFHVLVLPEPRRATDDTGYRLSDYEVNEIAGQLGRAIRTRRVKQFVSVPMPLGVVASASGTPPDDTFPTVRVIAVYDVYLDAVKLRIDVVGHRAADDSEHG